MVRVAKGNHHMKTPEIEKGGWLGSAVWTLGWLTQVALVLHLAAIAFHPWLNSDHLYPHAFARDLLAGEFPVSGWKFGTAPFFLPDYAIFVPLISITGPGGWSYPLYALIQYTGISLAMAWLFYEMVPEKGKGRAFSAAFWGMNCLLLTQWIPGHELGLWWIALPGFHGGTLLSGLAWMAWQLRIERLKLSMRGWRWGLNCLWIVLGCFSNILLLFHFLFPWLFIQFLVLKDRTERRHFWNSLSAVVSGVGGFLGLKLLLGVFHIFDFARHFRYVPTLSHLESTGEAFVASASEGLWRLEGAVLVAVFLVVVSMLLFRSRLDRETGRWRGWLVVQTAVVLALPLLAGYWKDPVSSRYWLPLWVIPVIWFGLLYLKLGSGKLRIARWMGGLVAMGAAAGALIQLPFTSPELWRFPQPSTVVELDRWVRNRGYTMGLSEYWNFHYANQLAESDHGWRILPVEPDGQPYFWCVNVAWFLESDGEWPRYDFVVIDGLDQGRIARRYGPPEEIVRIGRWTVWVYGKVGQARIRDTLEPAVRAYFDR